MTLTAPTLSGAQTIAEGVAPKKFAEALEILSNQSHRDNATFWTVYAEACQTKKSPANSTLLKER